MKNTMKYWGFICLLLVGCKSSKKINFTKNIHERFIELSNNQSKDVKVAVLAQNEYRIQLAASDIIELYNRHLKTTNSHSAKKELERESDYLKNSKSDIQVNNIGLCCTKLPDGLDSWVVHDLLLIGKAQVWSNGTERISRIRYVYHEDSLGGITGTVYDMNKKAFFQSVIALGE